MGQAPGAGRGLSIRGGTPRATQRGATVHQAPEAQRPPTCAPGTGDALGLRGRSQEPGRLCGGRPCLGTMPSCPAFVLVLRASLIPWRLLVETRVSARGFSPRGEVFSPRGEVSSGENAFLRMCT
ncbi:unnamed protein product [Rangifer tarandus platyrhynchus]|uniref:Uncharacterized protein n=1 Tax=Rangifer tarandus platyrhynchus TaxID=3082113 RepID=A0ABN8YW46_RANTA|nr:unnamed protein product [Rangifer tarandus platyrhynchus]